MPTLLSDIAKLGEGVGEKVFGGPKGELYMTLARKGDDAVNLYALDIASGKFSPLFDRYGQEDFGDSRVGYTSKFSPSGDMFAYAAASRAKTADGSFAHGGIIDMFVFDVATQRSIQVSKGAPYARLPQWSPDSTKVSFTALERNSTIWQPDDWDIYIADLKGNIQRLTHGTYPHWSPDGDKILFMRSDGLYLYNIIGKNETRIYAFDKKGSISLKIGLSPDGSMLAMSVPGAHSVPVFKIFSWDPFRMDAFKVIRSDSEDFFWPVFSPDGRFLALQQTGWNNETQMRLNPRIVIYELETLMAKTIMSLEKFNFDFAFNSDWRYEKGGPQNGLVKSPVVDEEVLKNTLVDGSPWAVTWNVSGSGFSKSGTQKINFSRIVGGTELAGSFSDISDERIQPGLMKDISTRRDGCIRFTAATTGTGYVYCLTEDGVLDGYLSGISPGGSYFTGNAAARPVSR